MKRANINENRINKIIAEEINNVISGPESKVQAIIDKAISVYQNAVKEQDGDQYALMDKEGYTYGLNGIRLVRGKVVFLYVSPYGNKPPVAIKALEKRNGKVMFHHATYLDEGWEDVKKEVKRIESDAQRGIKYFQGYDVNWEDKDNPEGAQSIKNFNKSIGLGVNTGID